MGTLLTLLTLLTGFFRIVCSCDLDIFLSYGAEG
jgi:hypothetical protein